MLGAERVIAIDDVPSGSHMARDRQGARRSTSTTTTSSSSLKEMTGGRGPDACIDAVGMEAHGTSDRRHLRPRQAGDDAGDRPARTRCARRFSACRKGGTVSIPGVYGGLLDKIPIGAAFAKGLTFKMGQTHVQKYMQPLLERIQNGEIDPSFVITHRVKIDDAANAYKTFRNHSDGCVKVVLNPS